MTDTHRETELWIEIEYLEKLLEHGTLSRLSGVLKRSGLAQSMLDDITWRLSSQAQWMFGCSLTRIEKSVPQTISLVQRVLETLHEELDELYNVEFGEDVTQYASATP